MSVIFVMSRFIYVCFSLFFFISVTSSFIVCKHLRPPTVTGSHILRLIQRENGVIDDKNGYFYSTLFTKDQINDWWVQINKPLLTIGMKGVSSSQINGLKELILQHKRVRVKIASDKIDVDQIVDSIVGSELTKDSIVLLHIRPREVMFSDSKTQY